MWILNFLPNWIVHGLVFAGAFALFASVFLKIIPVIKTYTIPVRVAGVVALLLGFFLEGAVSNQEAWEKRVKELEAKVAEAQAESAKQNTEIVEKTVYKTKIVKERGDEVIKYIDKEIVKYDATCIIPKEFIAAHNKAAAGVPK